MRVLGWRELGIIGGPWSCPVDMLISTECVDVNGFVAGEQGTVKSGADSKGQLLRFRTSSGMTAMGGNRGCSVRCTGVDGGWYDAVGSAQDDGFYET